MRDTFPSGMEKYLSMYGWHFSRKLCEWACSRMRRKGSDGSLTKQEVWNKDRVETMLKAYGIDIPEAKGYDCVFVANMGKADYFGSSITDEPHLALFVKDYLCDADGYDEVAMTRFYADCIGKGCQIPWEDVI